MWGAEHTPPADAARSAALVRAQALRMAVAAYLSNPTTANFERLQVTYRETV